MHSVSLLIALVLPPAAHATVYPQLNASIAPPPTARRAGELARVCDEFLEMIARTRALDDEVDRRVAALWTPEPGARKLFWRQSNLEIERLIRTLDLREDRAPSLRRRLQRLSREVAPRPGARFKDALRLDAELLARTLERLTETSKPKEIEDRLVDAIRILGHAHVLIGRGTASLARRMAAYVTGRDYDLVYFELFWRDVRLNVLNTLERIGGAAEDGRVIAARVANLLRERGDVEAACARSLAL